VTAVVAGNKHIQREKNSMGLCFLLLSRSKDNVSYSVRDNARSTGTSTADYRRGNESVSVKIRLK
jgi:hypothetical protein